MHRAALPVGSRTAVVLIALTAGSCLAGGRGSPPDAPADSDGADSVPSDGAGLPCAADVGLAPGWVQVWVDVAGTQGSMDSPIVNCAASGGRFVVTAEGVEMDGLDWTHVLVAVDRGFVGPGTYAGRPSDGIRAEVSHDDVGAFASTSATACSICVNLDRGSGTFQCSGLRDTATMTVNLDVLAGSFFCP